MASSRDIIHYLTKKRDRSLCGLRGGHESSNISDINCVDCYRAYYEQLPLTDSELAELYREAKRERETVDLGPYCDHKHVQVPPEQMMSIITELREFRNRR